MKTKLIAVSLMCVFFSANAENIKLAETEANCKKVNGFGGNDKLAIATKYKVPLASVTFMGAKWGYGQYGQQCVFIFDTANGPKKCSAFNLLSDDGGKTAFGVVSMFDNPNCWER